VACSSASKSEAASSSLSIVCHEHSSTCVRLRLRLRLRLRARVMLRVRVRASLKPQLKEPQPLEHLEHQVVLQVVHEVDHLVPQQVAAVHRTVAAHQPQHVRRGAVPGQGQG